jgi:hypothetical protein
VILYYGSPALKFRVIFSKFKRIHVLLQISICASHFPSSLNNNITCNFFLF